MGLERYRALQAMLDLREFTVEDLAECSRVKPVTVQTILDRADRYVDKVRRVPTGRPGGQPWLYRLREEGRTALMDELRDFEREPFRSSAYETQPGRPPLPMLVAEDFLLQRLPALDEHRKRRNLLLDIGRRLVEDMHETVVESMDDAKLGLRLRVGEWLVQLAEAELAGGVAVPTLAATLASDVWPSVLRVADLQLARGFVNRVRRSEVFECVPTWRLFPPRAAGGSVAIYNGSPRTTERVEAALRKADVHYATLTTDEAPTTSSPPPLVCVVTIDSPLPPPTPDLNHVSRTLDAFTPLVAITDDFRRDVLDAALRDNIRYLPLETREDEAIAGSIITPLTQIWSLQTGLAS